MGTCGPVDSHGDRGGRSLARVGQRAKGVATQKLRAPVGVVCEEFETLGGPGLRRTDVLAAWGWTCREFYV